MILASFSAAISQLGAPEFRSVLIRSLGITLAALVAVVFLVGWGVSLIGPFSVPLIGVVDPGAGAGIFAGGLALVMSVFLILPASSLVIGLFLDDIADAVEKRHYPGLPPTHPMPIAEALADGVRFFFVVVGANIVALVFYLIFAPFAPLIFIALNGYLISREYFQLVAVRRMSLEEAGRLRKRHMPALWAAGCLLALPLSVPVLNLVVPVLGVAALTHIFHRVANR